jgi:hypothetical protein
LREATLVLTVNMERSSLRFARGFLTPRLRLSYHG